MMCNFKNNNKNGNSCRLRTFTDNLNGRKSHSSCRFSDKKSNNFIAAAWLLATGCLLNCWLPQAWAAPSSSSNTANNNNNNSYQTNATAAAAWPPMQHIDIWSADAQQQQQQHSNADAVETNYNYVPLEFMQNHEAFEYVTSNFADSAAAVQIDVDNSKKNDSNAGSNTADSEASQHSRQSKVIHLFPVPVDGECLSDDGRRTGSCFNAYECRAKGGMAKGECAMGFGVCCIFIANCNTTISNNITYLVSPHFPSFLPHNMSTPCNFKVQMMNSDISQLRFDFYHFSLGQPNRRNGVCDGDALNITGGPAGAFTLCGQNSGQHIYYDVGGTALPRQTLYGNLRPLTYSQLYPNLNSSTYRNPIIEINMRFRQRFLPTRLWEIRIAQIPFSQRAPVGCLQYYTGTEGIIQTFNFAENGRHLANQHYRICMRQEAEMCSIMYEPCDEQSFRIGPSEAQGSGGSSSSSSGMTMAMAGMMPTPASSVSMDMNGSSSDTAAGGSVTNSAVDTPPAMEVTPTMPAIQADDANTAQMMNITATATAATTTTTAPSSTTPTTEAMTMSSSTPAMTTAASSTAAAATTMGSMPSSGDSGSTAATTAAPTATTSATSAASSATTLDTRSSTTPATTTTAPPNDDVDEGSGDEPLTGTPTRRPRPVRGGFDLLGFLRSAFDFASFRAQRNGRQLDNRQFFGRCRDRLTMPCIIEDFIAMGPMTTPVPGCEPVHCGASFCASGMWPCRVESTVTPFYIGVHFGDGAGKGSAEDNIGACLRYTQVQCV